MLNLTKSCCLNKQSTMWLFLSLSAFILELISLYGQHVMLLKPCTLCIYQRCALFGIILSGLLLSTTFLLIKIGGGIIWIYSSWNGLILAKNQNAQLHHHSSSPFTTCDFSVNFPNWLPLDKWIPSVFYANGDCTEYKWYFLTLEISEWMIIIFLFYLIIPTTIATFHISKHLKNIYITKDKKNNNNI